MVLAGAAARDADAQPAGGLVTGPANPTSSAASSDQPRVVAFDVRVNGRPLGRWSLLQRGNAFHLPVTDLPMWRVRPGLNVPLVEHSGVQWFPLSAIPGMEMRVESAENRLDVHVPETALLPQGLPPLPRGAAPAPAPRPPAGPAESTRRYLPMEVRVNGSRAGNWVLLDQQGALHAPEEAFTEWRITRSPQAVPVEARGQRWYPLSSVPGFESQVDLATQSIDLRFSPHAFTATRIATQARQRPPLSPSIPAAFLNYDLNLTTQNVRGQPSTRELGALTELGLSNDWGVLTSSHVGTGLAGSTDPAGAQWRRLETTFTRDLPDRNVSVRVGDSTTRPGVGGRAVYFGGLQIARNWALTPGFVTQPIPLISGVSTAPSTVELYINDALRQTSRVPAGPFAIENLQQLTGSGQARVVVRDVLGRETVLVQDFFTDGALLQQGLNDWSVEVGAVRRNLLQRNADYGPGFTSGLFRHGVNPSTTVEVKGEAAEDTQALKLALTRALPAQVLGQVSVARSRDALAGNGFQATLALEHRNLRHGFAARWEHASAGFRQLGFHDGFLPPRLVSSLSYNYTHPDWGNLGVAYARSDTRTSGRLSTYSLNYTARVGAASTLALSLTRVEGPASGTAVGISFVAPLDGPFTALGSATFRDGQNDAYAGVSRPLSQETGFGGRALAGTRGGEAYSEGGAYYQGSRGFATADLFASSTQQTLRLGGRGGLAVADGQVFTARQIEDSFAVVHVPGYPNVGIGFQGSSLTRTDADGVAILPRLRPYDVNSIRLDPRELPISAELDNIEQIAVPASRSAVKVTFPVRSGRGALVKLLLDDGLPAPAGAEVELVGDRKEFFVARRGEAFVTGLLEKNRIKLKHNGATCTVEVNLPPPGPADAIARVGPLTGSGVTRCRHCGSGNCCSCWPPPCCIRRPMRTATAR
jgi:outer membrane usher protein